MYVVSIKNERGKMGRDIFFFLSGVFFLIINGIFLLFLVDFFSLYIYRFFFVFHFYGTHS